MLTGPGDRMRTGTAIAVVLGGMVCWYALADEPDRESTAFAPVAKAPTAAEAEDADWLTDVTPHSDLAGDFQYLGTASCSASNCHGGDRSGGNRPPVSNDGHRTRDSTWGGEYSIWLQQDPHARAYDVLFDDLSVQMGERLGIEKVHESNRCLNCHAVNPHPENAGTVATARTTHTDGVGCEACHGPAGEWLDLHKQRDWYTLTSAQKAEKGFWNTDDVLTRARVCASCHVGGPGRDVDHDLIAAGHPRLNFEMSAYQAMIPKHWNDAANLMVDGGDEKALKAAFEAKLWAVGQAVAAEASLEQTVERAKNENGHRVWPEFAEYGCFACHHDLQLDVDDQSWRQDRGFGTGRVAGQLPWSTWYTASLETLEGVDRERWRTGLADAREVLEKTVPKRAKTIEKVEPLRDLIAIRAVELNEARFGGQPDDPFGRDWRNAQRDRLRAHATANGTNNWDTAAQAWLGLAALERADALEEMSNGTRLEALVRIREALKFPSKDERFSSPRDFRRDRVNLPAEFDKVQ